MIRPIYWQPDDYYEKLISITSEIDFVLEDKDFRPVSNGISLIHFVQFSNGMNFMEKINFVDFESDIEASETITCRMRENLRQYRNELMLKLEDLAD